MIEECASYMDACIYNSESKKILSSELVGVQNMFGTLKKEKYEVAIHLSYAVILGIMKDHEEALKHAQIGFKKALMCMKICYRACVEHLARHNQIMSGSIRKRLLKRSQYNLIESPHYKSFHDVVNSALPFLQYFHNKYHSTSKVSRKVSLKSRFHSFFNEENLGHNLCIDEITGLKPLDPSNISNNIGIHTELSKENMINKLILVISSMYLISVELKHSKGQTDDAKIWFKKTIQSCNDLFPSTSMLNKELIEKYVKEYKVLDIFPVKKRNQTLESRGRTPIPPSNLRPWSRNRSNCDKTLEHSKNFGKVSSRPISRNKISSTPQPRPVTSYNPEKKRSRNDIDEGKISDFILNSYDLY